MQDTLDYFLTQCRELGLRRTKSLTALLQTLLERSSPMTLADLSESPRLKSLCDKVTVYRMLQRLGNKGIIRRLGLHERSAYFTLLIPGTHKDYLICTECNHIEPIQAPCPVHALEREIAEKSGYQKLYHELEFFGICPNCSPS